MTNGPKPFTLDDLDTEIEHEIAGASENSASAFMSAGKGTGIHNRVALKELQSVSGATRLSAHPTGTKPAVKQMRYGKPTQISWKTFETQKEAFEKLVADSGLKRADIFEIGLSLALQKFEKSGNFDKVDRSFGTEDLDK